MFDRFTDNAKLSMNRARQEAERLGHDFLGTEHMLLGILSADGSTAVRVLAALKVDRARLRAEVARLITLGTQKPLKQLPFTPRAKKVLELSMQEAGRLGHNYIGSEHILLGLILENEGVAAVALKNLGVDLDTAREMVVEELRSTRPTQRPPPSTTRGLFSRFTQPAKDAMNCARVASQKLNHEYLGTEHMLLGLLEVQSSVAIQVLTRLGLDLDEVRRFVMKIVKPGPSSVHTDSLPFTPRAKQALELSLAEAEKLGHGYIGTEHLLLGLIRLREGIAFEALETLGAKYEPTKAAVLEFLATHPSEHGATSFTPEQSLPSTNPSSIRRQVSYLLGCAEILRLHGENDLADELERVAKRLKP